MSARWQDVVVPIAMMLGSALLALAAVAVAHRVLQRLGRRSELVAELATRAYRPGQVLATVLAVHLVLLGATTTGTWRAPLLHALLLAVIASTAWLAGALLMVVEDVALARVRTDVRDNRHARRIHTQITLVRRVTLVVVAVLAGGTMLMTFPSARAAGTTLLASASVIGAIAALAAQSLLGNVFAGMQIAFSDAIRLDDVVVVEGQWGRIEDITLTYVVVHLWDDRRLILPTSYFMKTPFENWTRRESALLGTVEVDLDWTVPVAAMRDELRRIAESSELWDGRVCVLQVTEATHALVRVRALVSAADAPTLWDLRCLVREGLVDWLRREHPESLPRVRVAAPDRRAVAAHPGPTPVGERNGDGDGDARMFGQTADGERREQTFSGPQRS
ncbi:Small-conductance mechanosensitive channel [Streptoalloteichus tenebrarius]|uniref:Small-conductance mechanosensitive channel n=1 Tax=Streptoalloteichus tenebrarius (strain ATCC 17920 / DSM 40477 / JCM 4838 / CBS 697.72 / NBRC 16177 / NCIMB 11028 / NRRL B-12390 / A12253. 1 / ISP 5477) TaxID=1933 RepID=A0ABT1HSP2_STRSD|nr:mechanosensitive ion channel domain-containing protein [Streptoalloteichus tenebrarius]MCP2258516.1 Small-conductance mechanosensitive channel [Streptoalloteichus tenebrarius]BFF04121.1 mechanosensitive ion channel [Streptoalloteichus tenebrarius]